MTDNLSQEMCRSLMKYKTIAIHMYCLETDLLELEQFVQSASENPKT